MNGRNKRADTVVVILLCLLTIALAVRARYGFCWSDESFYLTFAQRLWNGQQLILDEWHPVQFYSTLTYPFLTLYRLMCGTTGIYLFARLLYLLLALGVSLLIYFTFRKKTGVFPAAVCAVMMLSYSRGNIWGLSYYNLFLLLVMTGFCLVAQGRGRPVLLILAGVSLGFCVLCVPYFAPFILIALGAFMVKRSFRKDALQVFSGICVSAAYFLLLYFPKDLGAVLTNLSFILSDPEHQGGPFVNLLAAIRDVKLLFYWEAGVVAFGIVLLFLGDRLLPKRFGHIPGLLLALVGAVISLHRYRRGETGFAFYPYALFTLPCVVLGYLKRQQSIFGLCLQATGVCIGLAMALSSNTEAFSLIPGVLVYSMGVVVSLDGSPHFSVRGFSTALAVLVLLLTLNSRFTTVFRDAPMDQLDTVMTQGPASGIYTTEEHARQYQEILYMLQDLEQEYGTEEPIFISKLLPWGYLACSNPCGAPTAWRTALNSQRLEAYYELHPESIPKIVVVLKPEIGSNDDLLVPNDNVFEGWLWDYMEEHNYSQVGYICAQVFISPLTQREEIRS